MSRDRPQTEEASRRAGQRIYALRPQPTAQHKDFKQGSEGSTERGALPGKAQSGKTVRVQVGQQQGEQEGRRLGRLLAGP